MAQDPTQVRVGITGTLMVGPVGSTEPTATAGSWPVAWVDLGLLADGGAPKMKPQRTVKDIMAWQRYRSVRTFETARTDEWTFTLLQRTGNIMKLAHGGGTVTALGGGDYKYTPPAPGTVYERAFGLEVVDGTFIDRYVLRRGFVTDTGEISFTKEDAVQFALTVKTLEPASGSAWELVASNDAALAS